MQTENRPIPATLLQAPQAAKYDTLWTHETEAFQTAHLSLDTGSISHFCVPLSGHGKQEMNKRSSLPDAVSPHATITTALVTSLYPLIEANIPMKKNLDESFSDCQQPRSRHVLSLERLEEYSKIEFETELPETNNLLKKTEFVFCYT